MIKTQKKYVKKLTLILPNVIGGGGGREIRGAGEVSRTLRGIVSRVIVL